jgi:prepilin-type N-terminal cleavage/methylation domain-containing protein
LRNTPASPQPRQGGHYAVRNTNRGFTLIELALVALIIAILVSVSTPLFRRTYYAMQLDETAYNIAKFMHYARAKAISERLRTKITIDGELRKYWLTINTNPRRPEQFEHLKGRLGRFYTVPRGIEIESAKSFLIFYPNGRSDDFKLLLKREEAGGTRIKVIEVKKETGEAHVQEYQE